MFHVIVVQAAVVGARIPVLEQAYHFRPGPDDGPVAVCRLVVGRAVVVEGGVEAHSRAHAGAVHLSAVQYLGADGMPAQLRHGAVSDTLDPSLVDGVGDAVDIDGRGRCFQIGVVAVHQLVPEAFRTLVVDQPLDVAAQLFEQEGAFGMVVGQRVEQLAVGQDGPSVGAYPVVGGLLRQAFHIAVAVQSFSGTNIRSMNWRLILAASSKYLAPSVSL